MDRNARYEELKELLGSMLKEGSAESLIYDIMIASWSVLHESNNSSDTLLSKLLRKHERLMWEEYRKVNENK